MVANNKNRVSRRTLIMAMLLSLAAILTLGLYVRGRHEKQAENVKMVNFIQESRNYENADVAFSKLRTNPNDAMAHRTLAEHYARTGQSQQELQELREAVKSNPNNAHDLMRLGSVLRRTDKEEAVRVLTKIAESNYYEYSDQAKEMLAGMRAGTPSSQN